MYKRLLATQIITTLIISLCLGEEQKTDTDNGLDRVRRNLVEPTDDILEETFDPDEDTEMEQKWSGRPEYKTFDSLASSLIKRYGDGRGFDTLASVLIGKRYGDERSFDTLASGLIGKRSDGRYGSRYFDTLASSLVGKRFDQLASGLIGKRPWDERRYRQFDSLASSLIGKRSYESN